MTNWKETPASMWAWLTQRLSAVFALGLITYHYFDPINQRAQNLLMAFVVFHAVLGLRVILLDLGLPDRLNKVTLWVLAGVGAVVIMVGAAWNR